MTNLEKQISRRTRGAYAVLRAGHPRQIVLTMAPGDLLIFREAGCRTKFTYAAFRNAIHAKARADAIARKLKRKGFTATAACRKRIQRRRDAAAVNQPGKVT